MKAKLKEVLLKWLSKMTVWVNKKLSQTESETQYLYIFVRKDLTQSQIAVQASHAAFEAARAGLYACNRHPNFVVIGIKSESKLSSLLDEVKQHTRVYPFYEGSELTSFSTELISGERRKPFGRFTLL